jgi:hypothetical protein
VQGDAGHPGEQSGGLERNHWKKEGRGGGEAQGVPEHPSPPKKKIYISAPKYFLRFFQCVVVNSNEDK